MDLIGEAAIVGSAAWTAKKVLGPTADQIGEDVKSLYIRGKERLLAKAHAKIPDANDGKRANLRVTQDVLWNGAFADSEVCVEYFAGILAAARSVDGTDDSAIQFVAVTKSLSAKQLHLHYVIYRTLNRLLVQSGMHVNVGEARRLHEHGVWLAGVELNATLQIEAGQDLTVLHAAGLLHEYRSDSVVLTSSHSMPYVSARATSFGVMLYAAAHNRLSDWRDFSDTDFGEFPGVPVSQFVGANLEALRIACGVPSEPSPS